MKRISMRYSLKEGTDMESLPEIKKILYATDLGDNVRPVFKCALSLARKYDAQIIMLHVVEPMSSAMQAIVETYLTDIDAKKVHQDGMRSVLSTMRQRLENFSSEVLDTHNVSSVRVREMLVVAGKTSEEILKAAEKTRGGPDCNGKIDKERIRQLMSPGRLQGGFPDISTVPVMIVPNQ